MDTFGWSNQESLILKCPTTAKINMLTAKKNGIANDFTLQEAVLFMTTI